MKVSKSQHVQGSEDHSRFIRFGCIAILFGFLIHIVANGVRMAILHVTTMADDNWLPQCNRESRLWRLHRVHSERWTSSPSG